MVSQHHVTTLSFGDRGYEFVPCFWEEVRSAVLVEKEEFARRLVSRSERAGGRSKNDLLRRVKIPLD